MHTRWASSQVQLNIHAHKTNLSPCGTRSPEKLIGREQLASRAVAGFPLLWGPPGSQCHCSHSCLGAILYGLLGGSAGGTETHSGQVWEPLWLRKSCPKGPICLLKTPLVGVQVSVWDVPSTSHHTERSPELLLLHCGEQYSFSPSSAVPSGHLRQRQCHLRTWLPCRLWQVSRGTE